MLIAKKSKASYSVPEPKAGVFLCLKERIAKLQNKDFYLCKGITIMIGAFAIIL